MPSIHINSVTLNPLQFANTNATLYHRVLNLATPYTNDGAIVIQPNGSLVTPVSIAGLLADTLYQVKVVLACGTINHMIISTGTTCAATTIASMQFQLNPSGPGQMGLYIYFNQIPAPAFVEYEVEIYKNNVPTSGGIYVGTYHTTGNVSPLTILDPAVIIPGITFYARVRVKCTQGDSAWSDYVSAIICRITSTAEHRVNAGYHELRVNTSLLVAVNTLYYVVFDNGSSLIGPFLVTVPSGAVTSGWITTGMVAAVATTFSASIQSVTPNPALGCIIIY